MINHHTQYLTHPTASSFWRRMNNLAEIIQKLIDLKSEQVILYDLPVSIGTESGMASLCCCAFPGLSV